MNILVPDIAVAEKILRSVAVYGFLLVAFRIAGKRQLGQMTAFDLIVLLIISNVLQNAAIGNDNSLGGGLLGATVILQSASLREAVTVSAPVYPWIVFGAGLLLGWRFNRSQLVVALAVGNPQTVKVTAVTTDGAGHFSIVPPLCTDCTWRVTSTTDQRIVRSLMPFGTDPTIPVIGFEDYTALLGANDQVIADQGSVVMRAVSGATPAAQVTVAATTLTLDVALRDAVFYDSNASGDLWNQTETQSSGVVWLPLVPLSASPSPTTSGTITLTRQNGGTVTTTATILSAWITFLTTDIP